MAIAALGAAHADDIQSNVAWAERAFAENSQQTPLAWPFSFIYGGRPSYMLLPSWERRVEVESVEGGQRRLLVFTDPDTKLEVRAVATAFTDITTSPKEWCVLQYHRPDERDGMVVAFRRHQSPYTGFACSLNAIDPEANYEVTISPGYTPNPSQTMKGAELRAVVHLVYCWAFLHSMLMREPALRESVYDGLF